MRKVSLPKIIEPAINTLSLENGVLVEMYW